MKEKKILHFIEDLDTGGTELSMIRLLKRLDPKRFESVVLSLKGGELRKVLNDLHVETIILKKARAFDVRFLFRLIRLFKKIRPDIVHCRNSVPVISYGVLASKICGIPVISSIHGRTHYINRSLKTSIWFSIMKLSDEIIVLSSSIRDEVARLSGANPDRFKVIHNGIQVHESLKTYESHARMQEFGLKNPDFIIGTVGNLRKIKGHEYLVGAFKKILIEKPDATLIIIGDGEERSRLAKLADDLGITNNIKLLGYKKNASDLMKYFDIFVLPSLSEGFPNVILEAMALHIPVIATQVGGVGEIIDHMDNGYLIPAKDEEEIASSTVFLAKNEMLRKKYAENAFTKVKSRFSMDKMVAQYETIYSCLE